MERRKGKGARKPRSLRMPSRSHRRPTFCIATTSARRSRQRIPRPARRYAQLRDSVHASHARLLPLCARLTALPCRLPRHLQEIMKILAEKWNGISAERRANYNAQAAELKVGSCPRLTVSRRPAASSATLAAPSCVRCRRVPVVAVIRPTPRARLARPEPVIRVRTSAARY